MAIDIGRIAYEKYCESVGEELLKWEKIGKYMQDAWRSVAVAVLEHIDEQREEEARHDAFERDILD